MPARGTEQAVKKLDNRLTTAGITPATHEHTLQLVEVFKGRITETFPVPQQKRIFDALGLMMEVHVDQTPRPDGTPYVAHPLGVATQVFDHMERKDPDIVIAALLHDSVEDQAPKLAAKARQGIRRKDERTRALDVIEHSYGGRVRKIVHAVSNPDFDTILAKQGVTDASNVYTTMKNALYAEHVKEAIESSDVVLVKYFDFAANAFRLDTLPQGPKREKLLRKYAPVVRIFIDRLADNTRPINVTHDYKLQMESDLKIVESRMKQQLGTQ